MKVNDIEYIELTEFEKLKTEFAKLKEPKILETSDNLFVIPECCNVMAIVKVTKKDDKYLVRINNNGDLWEYPTEEADLMVNLKKDDKINCSYKDFHVEISMEFYKKAKEVFNLWKNGKLGVFICKTNHPVLLCDDEGLGFILAPRIEDEDIK